MTLVLDTEKESLQNLVKSCLLELNKVSLDLNKHEFSESKSYDEDVIKPIHEDVKSYDNKEILALKKELEEKDKIISEQDNKIYELNYVNNSLDEIKEYFAEQLYNYKEKELSKLNNKLSVAVSSMAEKDAKIKSLSDQLNNAKMDIARLESSVSSKEDIISLKKELEYTKREIYKKDNEISTFKEHYIPKEELSRIKDEIYRRDDRIKRLEEINAFFADIKKESAEYDTKEERPPFKLDK